MRSAILGIIVLCLTLTASVAFAQRVESVKISIDLVNITEEQKQQFYDQRGITLEEFQRQIDSGEANVVASSFDGQDFDIGSEELPRAKEYSQREILNRMIFAEIGFSEEDVDRLNEIINSPEAMAQFQPSENIAEMMENLTPENYVEVSEVVFDQFIHPIMNNMMTETANFVGEDKFAILATRLYQMSELDDLYGVDNEDFIEVGLTKLLLLPELLDLTEDQLAELTQMQKELVAEQIAMGTMEIKYEPSAAEQELLIAQLEEATTDEERQAIAAQWSKKYEEEMTKSFKEQRKSYEETSRKASAKMKTRLDALLTAEQKAKLAQIMQDVPDYLKLALGKQTTESDAAAEPTAAAWRPGANSWVPGMGAPRDLENYPREAPRVREPRPSERRFPGSE